jgi:iron uptake system EfeUOB component EfeO/EfeM
LLEAKYTYQVPIIPGNPQTKMVIRKPVIYDAVLKIERHLKKSLKKGDVSLEAAETDFNKVLDVAFNVLTVDTESFEKAITKTNDIHSLTNLFTKRVILVF